ncbi:hypothetical protein NMY22_g8974 [Coprinellus aureogranulatus]|nr:hypothetical protein NMY22_g8974 [Coprinellus aureogranulatus]
MSDFMFVKESQLQQVLHILAAHGFDLLSPEAATMTGSPTVTVHPRGLTGVSADEPPSPRSKSHSPNSTDVRVLSPDLACVGLSDEFGVDHWGLKIMKLVAFPDLIPGTAPSSQNSSNTDCSSPISSDDGYFSHSPQSTSPSSGYPSRSHSYDDLHGSIHPPSKSASKHSYAGPYMSPGSRQLVYTSKRIDSPGPSSHQQQFFSFTRTPEGSSLTADAFVLATLFPANERHMVICGGELAAAEERMAGGTVDYSSDTEDDDGRDDVSMLKCLQVDLRKFGLDKHGLVNRFSRVLEQNGINHMYSSTFKTANLLFQQQAFCWSVLISPDNPPSPFLPPHDMLHSDLCRTPVIWQL